MVSYYSGLFASLAQELQEVADSWGPVFLCFCDIGIIPANSMANISSYLRSNTTQLDVFSSKIIHNNTSKQYMGHFQKVYKGLYRKVLVTRSMPKTEPYTCHQPSCEACIANCSSVASSATVVVRVVGLCSCLPADTLCGLTNGFWIW